ncbi:lipoprotein [Halomonas sp. McH1-25]|uniref:LPS translocon maturation chaperone LptM n=1 Tax=unclassified Halomonas TaxID=2609666 RepID=UPI001EF6075F|nr:MULTISPECIES: lipoprotein [unclassified Halomonas]MCG7599475.1 lipoprotein [Halomonas sp. McH1-25]MCP1342862.1 lipoprotein [Halomonas sp. FL8]MCP1363245.1 lipoprotein [Halomonas sp. BBD45]
MRSRSALAALLLALALLAGCGQKGPLYLPGDEEAAETYDPAGSYESQPEESQSEAGQDNALDAGDTASSGARE